MSEQRMTKERFHTCPECKCHKDLVSALRSVETRGESTIWTAAADEIERLRRELRDVVIAAAQQAIRVRNRDAGTAPEPPAARDPDGYAYRYHDARGDVIRFNGGQQVNGGRPFEAVPYWLGKEPSQPSGDGWTAVTDRLPAFTEDQCEFVLVYSETHDLMGAQFAVMRVADFYFYDPDHPDDIGTADSKVVTHWKPLAGPTPTKGGEQS